jgi:apolipoprotein N-acyltransferase
MFTTVGVPKPPPTEAPVRRTQPRSSERRAWWWPIALLTALTGVAWLIPTLGSEGLPTWAQAVLVMAGTLAVMLAVALPARQLAAARWSRDAAELVKRGPSWPAAARPTRRRMSPE